MQCPMGCSVVSVDDVVKASKKAIDDAAIDFADLAEEVMGDDEVGDEVL